METLISNWPIQLKEVKIKVNIKKSLCQTQLTLIIEETKWGEVDICCFLE